MNTLYATKSRVTAVILSLAVLAACSCAKTSDENPVTTKPLTKVTLAASKNIWNTLSLVAADQGYFKEEGLDVDIQFLQAGRYCLDAVLSKSADFGDIVEVNIAFLAFSGNSEVSVISTIVESSESSALVARKSSGISKPEDLKSRKVALAPGTTSDVFANWFLRKYGIAADDVTIMRIQPQAMQGALISGGVDAVSVWQPFVHNIMKALGDDGVLLSDPQVYTGYEAIAVNRKWAAANAEVVGAFLRAHKKAEHFVASNPDKAIAIVSQAIGLEKDVVAGIWNQYIFVEKMDRETMVGAVTKIGDWIKTTQEGYNDKELPDYGPYFDDKYFNRFVVDGGNLK